MKIISPYVILDDWSGMMGGEDYFIGYSRVFSFLSFVISFLSSSNFI